MNPQKAQGTNKCWPCDWSKGWGTEPKISILFHKKTTVPTFKTMSITYNLNKSLLI